MDESKQHWKRHSIEVFVRNIKYCTALLNRFHVPYTVSQKKLTLEPVTYLVRPRENQPLLSSWKETRTCVIWLVVPVFRIIGLEAGATNLFSSHRMSVTRSHTIIRVRINIFNKNGVYITRTYNLTTHRRRYDKGKTTKKKEIQINIYEYWKFKKKKKKEQELTSVIQYNPLPRRWAQD